MKPALHPLVLVDTREQCPLAPCVVRGHIRVELVTERATLDAGDYSLPGLSSAGGVALERKSCSDLYGTCFGGRLNSVGEQQPSLDRFRAELARLRPYARKAIVVEGDERAMWGYAVERALGDTDRARLRLRSLRGMLTSFFVDFGVPTIWCADRNAAALFVGTFLERIWSQHTGGEDARKATERGHTAEGLPWLREAPTDEALEASARAALLLEQKSAAASVEAPQRFAAHGGMPAGYGEQQRARERARRAAR
jgi:ERCC4-type nuclease